MRNRTTLTSGATAVLCTVAATLGAGMIHSQPATASSLGGGLELVPLTQTTQAFAPAVKLTADFSSNGDLDGQQLRISGHSMAPTTNGAPAWSALTNANKFTVSSGSAVRPNAELLGQYSPARVPWMNSKFVLTGTMTTITTSTSAGFLILAAADGNNGIAAQFMRTNNLLFPSTNRWRLRIIELNGLLLGIPQFSVIAEGDLFANSTSNPVGAQLTITMSFDPTTNPNLSVTGVDAGSNSVSVSANVSTSAGVYAGMMSLSPSTTRYTAFEIRMT